MQGTNPVAFLTAGDIKQFFYCPRIVYFRYLMPSFRPTTYKMEEGKLRQAEEVTLEKRRTLVRFNIKGYRKGSMSEERVIERLFSVKLSSLRLGISGIVDMAIIAHDEVIPVDFKDGAFSVGEVIPLHHKYQLLIYGLLLEERHRKKAKRGFIHSLEDGTTKEVYFTDGARMYLTGKIRKIREILNSEIMPDETPYRGRCKECEFRPVCRG